MTLTRRWLPVGALTLLVGAGGVSTVSAQEKGNHAERVQRAARGDRQKEQAVPRARAESNRDTNQGRTGQQAPSDRRDERQIDRGDSRGSNGNSNGRYNGNNTNGSYRNRDWRDDDRNYGSARGGDYRGPRVVVPAPRVIYPRSAYPRRYGNGGNFSVYFGVGSGYRYGSPYSGRVYGYRGPVYGGARRYYGDVRLQVRPRDAAVYVDGYYAGIVDDFDGVFQRLTLEVGPHEVMIERPGFEPQVYNIYVDPTRTVDVRADLYPERY
jgi:hypothetical protein